MKPANAKFWRRHFLVLLLSVLMITTYIIPVWFSLRGNMDEGILDWARPFPGYILTAILALIGPPAVKKWKASKAAKPPDPPAPTPPA